MAGETIEVPASALPPEGGQEYLDKMVSRAETSAGGAIKLEEKPADQGEGDKRYKDLQAQFTRISQELAEMKKVKPPEAAKEPEKKPEEKSEGEKSEADKAADEAKAKADKEAEDALPKEAKDAKSLTDKAGLDWSEINQTFAEKGQLADEHYAKLEAIGIPRDMVDSFTAGQVALQKSQRSDLLSDVGGADGYAKVAEWARDNVSQTDLTAYNSIVTGRDPAAAKLAIAGLKAKFDAANGVEPKLRSGDTNGATSGYSSAEQMKADMRKPEYSTSAAFRKQVEDKVRASTF